MVHQSDIIVIILFMMKNANYYGITSDAPTIALSPNYAGIMYQTLLVLSPLRGVNYRLWYFLESGQEKISRFSRLVGLQWETQNAFISQENTNLSMA